MLKAKPIVAVALVLAPIALLAVACSRPPEQQLLTQFFRAARGRDNSTTSRMSAVTLDPREQGSVESFSITSIGEEKRTPLTFKPLLDAVEKMKAEETEFLKKKIEYQTANDNANDKIIREVLKLEGLNGAKLTAQQAKVKAEWDVWRAGINDHARAVSQARAAVSSATGAAEASLTQPGQPQLDPAKFEGESISKDVVVAARMKTPEGADVDKTLTVTFTRVSGKLDGVQREGRPIITKITGL